MKALVGYTGFVGSNIYASGTFDAVYNSKNITDAYATNPDLLVYSGLRAEKYLANNAPEKDWNLILQAENNIERINPKKLVFISTIDVFKNPVDVDEDSLVDTVDLQVYGYNRYQIELWVRERYPDALIIRLPGLFGQNIKKNFIYDYVNEIPFMLKREKMNELAGQDKHLNEFYSLQENGFYKLNPLNGAEKELLKRKFKQLGFSALNFTDSRSVYQFYNLRRLWGDIQTALTANITLWHPATEPISAGELYHYLCGDIFINKLNGKPVNYNYQTKYSDIFGGKKGYICNKETVMYEIKEFISSIEGCL